MKQIKHYSAGELFFTYWNGHLQPIGRTIEQVKEFLLQNPAQYNRISIKSNYRASISIEEILNP
jgi:hypothetical protein